MAFGNPGMMNTFGFTSMAGGMGFPMMWPGSFPFMSPMNIPTVAVPPPTPTIDVLTMLESTNSKTIFTEILFFQFISLKREMMPDIKAESLPAESMCSETPFIDPVQEEFQEEENKIILERKSRALVIRIMLSLGKTPEWEDTCMKLAGIGIGDWNFCFFDAQDLPSDMFSLNDTYYIKQKQEDMKTIYKKRLRI